MDSAEEKRRHTRYTRNDNICAQILYASESVDIPDKTIFCNSCDASASGLRIELNTEFPVNSQVDLWLAFEGIEKKFYLRGQVSWCYELADEVAGFQIGIELEDAYATDFTRWIELLEGLQNNS